MCFLLASRYGHMHVHMHIAHTQKQQKRKKYHLVGHSEDLNSVLHY